MTLLAIYHNIQITQALLFIDLCPMILLHMNLQFFFRKRKLMNFPKLKTHFEDTIAQIVACATL